MNLSGRMPEDACNGLWRVADALVASPNEARLAVIEYDVSKVVTDTGTGQRVPTLRLLAIEPVVTADEVLRARALIGRERRRRGGQDVPGQLDLLDELDPDHHRPEGGDGGDPV